MKREALWRATIAIDEHRRQTRATLTVHTADRELSAVGLAWRDPHDPEVPVIGDGLAAARALQDLAQQLFGATAHDLQAVQQRPPVAAE